jgi:hypothetical protein
LTQINAIIKNNVNQQALQINLQMAEQEQTLPNSRPEDTHIKTKPENAIAPEKILCPHCQRTATNGIKCKGICVADSDY